ncbi:MAG TPA: hypothetical protein VFV52_01370 [Bacilli bacterium]|nr:hypothetical protein [Bacilli bacterium]
MKEIRDRAIQEADKQVRGDEIVLAVKSDDALHGRWLDRSLQQGEMQSHLNGGTHEWNEPRKKDSTG